MIPGEQWHVYRHKRGWGVRRLGAKRAVRVLADKGEAWALAERLCRKTGGLIIVGLSPEDARGPEALAA